MIYSSSGKTHYNILGDATLEFGPYSGKFCSWFNDQCYINFNFKDNRIFFQRGGAYSWGKSAGLFFNANSTGDKSNVVGFRVVLAP